MEARLSNRQDSLEAKLSNRQDSMEARLDSMETRLMTRINDNQETLLQRVRNVETNLNAVVEIERSTNTLLMTMANVVSDLVKRVTDLEKKP
jgi:uncharacterized protein YllA (UPF0747 family)